MRATDDLMNVISGLGTGRDKNVYNTFAVRQVTSFEVNNAYRSSGLTRKVHDIYPLEMTRAGRDWQTKGDELDALYAEETRLKVWPKLRLLAQRARLYGGGALLLGINRGAPSDPITPETMRPGDLSFIHVLSPDQLRVEAIDRDPTSPFYGEPEYYRLTDSMSTLVDPSRVIPLIGQALPDPLTEGRFWGDPLLTSLWGALSNSDLVHQTVAALLPEIKADTISIPGLGQLLLSCEGESQVTKRIAAASLMQSMFNVRLLDGGDGTDRNPGDKWETRQLNVTGYPALMEAFIARVAAETDIPVTRLAGVAPGGLNASGDSEQKDFEKAVNSRQETELRPVLDRLDPFLAANVGQSEVPYFSFAPLSQLSETERWDIEKKRADTFAVYVNTGAFGDDLAASTRLAMAESDMWPGLAAEAEPEEFDPPEAEPTLPPGLTDAAPQPLYVRRDLLNGADLIKWAKANGFKQTLTADDMHVTVLYSRQPVDPMKMGEAWDSDEKGGMTIKPGGPRALERFGEGAVVLQFASWSLVSRHDDMIRNGASHDFPEYLPHITLTYEAPEGLDLAKIVPYSGELQFGPEIFEPLDLDWKAGIEEG
jgi:phage-related protein (TIGR01555 family)